MFTGGKITKFDYKDWTISIRNFEAFRAINHLGALQKTILPAFQGVIKGVVGAKEGANLEVDIVGMGKVIAEGLDDVITKIDGDSLERAFRILINPDYVSYAPKGTDKWQPLTEDNANEVFEGNIYGMFTVAYRVFTANYANFTKSSTGIFGALTQVFENAKSKFLEDFQKNSQETPSSTEQ